MPVIGHALAGVVVAAASSPRVSTLADRNRPSFVRWTVVLVTLAYVPDILAYLMLMAGRPGTTYVTHSLVLAVALSVPGAWAVSRMTGVSRLAGFMYAAGSIGLHDFLDVLESTDRMPFWPFSTWRPHGVLMSAAWNARVPLIVVTICVVAAMASWIWRSRRIYQIRPGRDWRDLMFIVLVIVAAVGTNDLRAERNTAVRRARLLLERGDYRGALTLCDAAEPWPSQARAGRIDHLRGDAWLGLGDVGQAEQYYLRSYRADPSYIWTVADLAELYASEEGSPAERQRRAQRWMHLLQSRFAAHPAMPALLTRAEQALIVPPTRRP